MEGSPDREAALETTEAVSSAFKKEVSKGILKGIFKVGGTLIAAYVAIFSLRVLFNESIFATLVPPDYRHLPGVGSRVAVWIVAELHLMLAAFLLGVPIFAVIVETIGFRKKDKKYDDMAYDFTKLFTLAGTMTAGFGSTLLVALYFFYPRFFQFMRAIFEPTWYLYIALLFSEVSLMYLYFLSWDWFQGKKKGLHITIGVLLNLAGTAILLVANAWTSFMMTPAGITESGVRQSLSQAVTNFAWMPLNIHRFIANIAFGGAVATSYAAYRFLGTTSEEDRAYYDWMGYTGNFIMISALIPLPFAGYWLGREIYAFSEQMGVSMMGGVFSWLWIIQAVLIGALFLGLNYYLWISMGKMEGSRRYRKYIKWILFILTACYAVWLTPHSLVASLEEARALGGAFHPVLGVLGVMSAKNTAVNLMILATYVSFLFYRRSNKVSTVSGAKIGNFFQGIVLLGAALIVLWLGIYGYFVPAVVRIGFSVYQVLSVLSAMILATLVDLWMYRRSKLLGEIRWGKMPERSQYVLLFLAISFTWLMGLMGYIRSGIRQHWHIYGVLKDTTREAFIPTHGFATIVISICVLLFFLFISFVFWMGQRWKRKRPDLMPKEAKS